MPTYADKLRELADLLDSDFHGHFAEVAAELLEVAASLTVGSTAQGDADGDESE